MRVINVANNPVALAEETVLAVLESVQAVADLAIESETLCEAVTEDPEDLDVIPEYVNELIAGVDPAVYRGIMRTLMELLLRYPVVFSKGQDNLECAAAVRHHNDTG